MSESPDFRSWAARVALQATKERDTSEAQRLMSIANDRADGVTRNRNLFANL